MAFIAFTAPWCMHCRALAPEFARVWEAFDGGADEPQVIVAELAESDRGPHSDRELLDRFGIDSFPQLLWFDASSIYPHYAITARPEPYSGARTFDAMAAFIEERSGVSRQEARATDAADADGVRSECEERGPLPSGGKPTLATPALEKVLDHLVAMQRRRQERQAEQLVSGLMHSGLAVDLARNGWQTRDGRLGTIEPFTCEALSAAAARAAADEWEHMRHAAAPQDAEPSSPPPLELPPHACAVLSDAYVACMRHRADRQHVCDSERHEYLLCMSARWAVHPDHHKALAEEYRRFDP